MPKHGNGFRRGQIIQYAGTALLVAELNESHHEYRGCCADKYNSSRWSSSSRSTSRVVPQ
eukprot:m.34366 g.34366  ORF g.34366 m.34366 type:complete len:60 (-) comp12294_c1_seq1:990-1169(-)